MARRIEHRLRVVARQPLGLGHVAAPFRRLARRRAATGSSRPRREKRRVPGLAISAGVAWDNRTAYGVALRVPETDEGGGDSTTRAGSSNCRARSRAYPARRSASGAGGGVDTSNLRVVRQAEGPRIGRRGPP